LSKLILHIRKRDLERILEKTPSEICHERKGYVWVPLRGLRQVKHSQFRRKNRFVKSDLEKGLKEDTTENLSRTGRTRAGTAKGAAAGRNCQ